MSFPNPFAWTFKTLTVILSQGAEILAILKRQEKKMAEIDDAVAALTPKLKAQHEELVLVLDAFSANLTALRSAIAENTGSPESLAALRAAMEQADEDLEAMKSALAAPPPAGTPEP